MMWECLHVFSTCLRYKNVSNRFLHVFKLNFTIYVIGDIFTVSFGMMVYDLINIFKDGVPYAYYFSLFDFF